MSRDERERLRDIVEALETIRDYVGGNLEEPSNCFARCRNCWCDLHKPERLAGY